MAVPVTDVDRAKDFYVEKVGFAADHDHTVSDELRFVQLTPPGSACSIAIGKGMPNSAEPGSSRGLQLVERGVGVSGWDKAMQIDPSTFSETEQRYMNALEESSLEESGYIMIQGSKPQTLGYGLNDSPVGLAAWILEKFRAWSDCDGDVEKSFTRDELLTNITIYWATQTINSSIHPYYEEMHDWSQPESSRLEVPVGMALFPKDNPPPREMAERFLNVRRWTEMPRGGHFTAMEEPELLAEEMRSFFRDLR